MLTQITFRISRNQLLPGFTREFPRSKFSVWCNMETDLLEIHSPTPTEADRVTEALRSQFRRVSVVPGSNAASQRTLVMACPALKGRSVSLLVERHGGITIPPVESENGWDTFRIVALDPTRVSPFFAALAELGEYKILRKKRLHEPFVQEKFMAPTTELLHGLSRKQCEALLLAVQEGYYEIPRRLTLVEIAKRRTRPRATLEEHLRKAECKIIKSMAPFVGVRMGSFQGPGRPRGKAFAARAHL